MKIKVGDTLYLASDGRHIGFMCPDCHRFVRLNVLVTIGPTEPSAPRTVIAPLRTDSEDLARQFDSHIAGSPELHPSFATPTGP